MDSAADLTSYYGSVGWIVDRTSQNRQVLGSVFLVRSQVAITCTHVLLPYFDTPEALGIDFPHVGKRYSIKEILPHSYFDPWLVRRTYQQPEIYPPHRLAVETNNLTALVLNPAPPPLEKHTVEKVTRMLKRAMPEAETSLAGSATQLQITSIIQTLLSNRSNQGTLTLFDDNNNPVAKFYLHDNQLTHVRYAHLYNEEALYRLLTLVEEATFQFTFVFDYEPEWAKFPPVQKSTAGLLLEAYTRLEQYQQIKTEFNNNLNIMISQAVPTLNLDPLPLEMRPSVACTWNHVRNGIPLGRLLKACNFDGATIMYALKYLRETGQIMGRDMTPPGQMEPSKLNISSNCSLERGMPISSICIDPDTRLPVVETGFILDMLTGKGDGHYVHSIGLPLTAAGSPLLVNGEVVGIHCGILTEEVEVYAEWIHPSLAIAGDQVYQCLDLSPHKKTTEVLAFTQEMADRLTADKENKDNKAVTGSGDFAAHTSFKLPANAPDMASGVSRTTSTHEALANTGQNPATASSPGSMSPRDRRAEDRARASGDYRTIDVDNEGDVLTSTGSFKKKSGFFESLGNILKGKGSGMESETAEVILLRQGLDSEKFEKVAPNAAVRVGDVVRMRMRLITNTYAAVLLKLNGEETVRLIYPESPAHEEQLAKGQIIEFPTHFAESSSVGRKKNVLKGIPVNSADGFDEIMVLTGAQPLVVRLFELGPDRVFNYVSKNLVGDETAGRFYVNRMEISKATPETFDSPNMFSVFIVELIHKD